MSKLHRIKHEAPAGVLVGRALMYNPFRDAPVVFRLGDGSLVMDAVPAIAGQDLTYYGYELPEGLVPGIEWDTKLTGRLTTEAAENMLDQFEGLALTNEHWWIEPGQRKEAAVGTFLQDASLEDTKIKTRCVVYDAVAIVKVESGDNELSIGGMAEFELNPARGTVGEPDFFIRRVILNHVAIVESGRAGPEARLLNHQATLADNKPEIVTMKITINGVEYDVPDAVAGEINRLGGEVGTLTNSVATLTTERDTAQGSLVAAQSQVTQLQNNAPDITVEATRIANEHAQFVTEATALGHTDDLALGAYDRTATQRKILNARGMTIADDASVDKVNGAWEFAVSHGSAPNRSAIDRLNNTNVEPVADPRETTRSSYFGGSAKKEA